MPRGLKRFQKAESLHFITFSCYRRLPFLSGPEPKVHPLCKRDSRKGRDRVRLGRGPSAGPLIAITPAMTGAQSGGDALKENVTARFTGTMEKHPEGYQPA